MPSILSSTSKYPPLTTTITTVLFLILFSINNCRVLCFNEEDPAKYAKYANCRNLNFTCGDGINIGYPFWGNKRPGYCGIPDYHLDCENDEFTEIEIMSQKYRVLDINPAHRIMKIARKDFMIDEDACPETFNTTTMNFTQFDYILTGFVNLTLSYGCSQHPPLPYNQEQEAPTNKFSCQTNITSMTDLMTDAYYWIRNLSGVFIPDTKQCIKNIDIPISELAVSELIDGPMVLNSILRKGFDVIYGVDEEENIDECFKCLDSGGACAYNDSISDPRLTCYSFDAPSSGSTKSRLEKKVAVGVGVGLGGFLTVILVVVFLCYRQRGKSYQRNSSTLISSRNISSGHSVRPDPENGLLAPIFSYEELEEATNNFDESKELGDGGFGTVYYGELKDGRAVAVKRLYENNCKRVEQFMNEVTILSNLRHKNLVILYGCTSRHSRELLLVYEFVPNGTVADHLHGERAGAGLVSWPIRLNIALESACALTYLHHSDIIHRDVKTNNILLDNNFHVKVADFGLSRLFPTDVTHISTAPQGTPGYVDPDYHQCYQLTDKSDVYSFGVVLIELISSKPAVDINRHRHEINLSNMAINKIHNHALHELVDPSLGFDSDIHVKTTITLVAELAFRCLQQDREIRPSMVEVFEVLKGIQNEGSKMPVAVEMDVPADEIKLMKDDTTPISPNSVTQKWSSSSTTPNNSS